MLGWTAAPSFPPALGALLSSITDITRALMCNYCVFLNLQGSHHLEERFIPVWWDASL